MIPPSVSVILAARNAATTVDAAIASARAQTVPGIEIIAVDDNSTDGTRARLEAHRAEDPRIMVLDGPGRGPGAARNRALAAASGVALAVLDADDIMHPERLAHLLALASSTAADIVADNLLAFHDDPERRAPWLLAGGPDWLAERDVSLADYIRCNALDGRGPALGYLKPLIRREAISGAVGGYDETLRIGEDYDLVARLMLAGARFRFSPTPFYLYRRHAASTSHRLRADDLRALLDAADRLRPALADHGAAVLAASNERRSTIETALAFDNLVGALKRRRPLEAVRVLAGRPVTARLLARSMTEGGMRRARARFAPEMVVAWDSRKRATLLLEPGDPALSAAGDHLARCGYLVSVITPARDDDPADLLRLVAGARPSALVAARPQHLVQAVWLISPEAVVMPLDDVGAVPPLNPLAR